MSPLEYGRVCVKVMRDKFDDVCIVYEAIDDIETHPICRMFPDGKFVHEELIGEEFYDRFYRGRGPVGKHPRKRAFTKVEAEYYLRKYCRRYNMDMSKFMIVQKFARRMRWNRPVPEDVHLQ